MENCIKSGLLVQVSRLLFHCWPGDCQGSYVLGAFPMSILIDNSWESNQVWPRSEVIWTSLYCLYSFAECFLKSTRLIDMSMLFIYNLDKDSYALFQSFFLPSNTDTQTIVIYVGEDYGRQKQTKCGFELTYSPVFLLENTKYMHV